MDQLLSLVPADKRDVVQKAIQQTFSAAAVESAAVLTGGLSQAFVYRIKVEGKEYVLRLVMQRDALRDPVRDYQCFELASRAGIAPPLHYANAEDGVSISSFIESGPLPDNRLMLLARVIKSIHALPLFPPLVAFLDGVDMFIRGFKSSGLLPESLTKEHFDLYAHIQRSYPRHDADLVSSHNDLNPGNLLFDGAKSWVIDWEAAFRNDRYVDLAIVANYYMSDPAEEDPFLRAYFGEALNDYHRQRFFLMRQVCQMYYGVLFLNLAASGRPPGFEADQNMETPTPREFQALVRAGEASRFSLEGQILYGKVQLNEALRQMKTPRFNEAIALMEASSADA